MALNFLPREAVKSGETGTVAFLTPKRLGAATIRNKLRRRMREIYRRHLAQPSETAYLVWIARPPALELPFRGTEKVHGRVAEAPRLGLLSGNDETLCLVRLPALPGHLSRHGDAQPEYRQRASEFSRPML